MNPAIMNLSKWIEKTVGAVRHRLNQEAAPCVGFSLVFFDPMEVSEKKWRYVIELAFDPHNPPPEEEREQLEKALSYVSEGVKRIMDSPESEIPDEFVVRGKLN